MLLGGDALLFETCSSKRRCALGMEACCWGRMTREPNERASQQRTAIRTLSGTSRATRCRKRDRAISAPRPRPRAIAVATSDAKDPLRTHGRAPRTMLGHRGTSNLFATNFH